MLALHEELRARRGGGIGLRDNGLLEAALNRPNERAAGNADIDCASLATTYVFAIAKDHPFTSGNQRTGFVPIDLCVESNGFHLDATEKEARLTMLQAAATNRTACD